MNPEKGGNTLRMARGRVKAPEAPPIGVLPPIGPTPDLPHPPKRRIIGTKTKIALALAVAAPFGAAAGQHHFKADEPFNRAGITRDVQAIPGQIADWFRFGKAEVPPFFDNTASKSSIEAGVNTIAVSQRDLENAYREQVAQNKDSKSPTVIFPVKFTADGQVIAYSFQPPLGGATDSQTGKPVIQERPGSINLKPDQNTEILVVAENAEVFQFQPKIIDGKEYFTGVFMKWQQNGEIYGLRIAGADIRALKSLGDVANAPVVPTRQQGGLDLSEAQGGLKLPLGTSTAKVDISNPDVILNFDRYNLTTGRWEGIKPNFVVDNPFTGQVKLMLPQNN